MSVEPMSDRELDKVRGLVRGGGDVACRTIQKLLARLDAEQMRAEKTERRLDEAYRRVDEQNHEIRQLQAHINRCKDEIQGCRKSSIIIYDPTGLLTLCRETYDKQRALQAIVDKLPKTADGVPIVPGMTIWVVVPAGIKEAQIVRVCDTKLVNKRDSHYQHLYILKEGGLGSELACWETKHCYSTREAALAATSVKDTEAE